MPKIECLCGNLISYGQIPNPNEWLIVSDVEYDNYSGNIDSEELYRKMKSMIVCESCSRIWIYWQGYQENPIPYLPDKII